MSISYLDPKVEKVSKLKLPVKLERLHKLFDEMEQVCMAMFTRKKQITLDSVRKNVEKNASKILPRLSVELFSQMLHIYPTSYSVKLVESKKITIDEASKYQYVLTPNLRDDIYPYYQKPQGSPVKPAFRYDDNLVVPSPPISPQKARNFGATDYVARSPRKSPVKPAMRPACLDFGPKFEAWRWKCRVKIFKFKLLEFLKAEHQKYLSEIDVQFEENGENLFHPDFVLKYLPDVPCAKLPAPEKPAIQKSMKDYLVNVEYSPLLKSIEKVTKQLRTPIKTVKTEPTASPGCHMMKRDTPMKARVNLLERIRAKEREAKEKEACRDLKLEKRLSHLEELKIRALNVIYSEYAKRTSMEHAALYQRLKISVGLRQEDFDGIVEILVELAPKHFSVDTVTSTRTRYVKMMDKDLAKITQIVDEELTRCRNKVKELMK
jgi:hypothetical protein